jgi:hypothetical protein
MPTTFQQQLPREAQGTANPAFEALPQQQTQRGTQLRADYDPAVNVPAAMTGVTAPMQGALYHSPPAVNAITNGLLAQPMWQQMQAQQDQLRVLLGLPRELIGGVPCQGWRGGLVNTMTHGLSLDFPSGLDYAGIA